MMKVGRVAAPVRQQTLRNLRQAIVKGRFRPGERLVERELCELTAVSRTSIREALRQLETEGLVTLIPNKGPCVAVVTPEEAKNLYQIRQVLEALAYRLFAERATPSQINAFRHALARLERAYNDGTPQDMVERSDDFYDVVLRGCGNKAIYSMLKPLHARITLLRKTSLSKPGRPARSIKEVKRILEAIERRDPEAAWDAAMENMRHAETAAMDMLHRLHGEKGSHSG
jgi:DNA-binding GntR family transcriptional regulator